MAYDPFPLLRGKREMAVFSQYLLPQVDRAIRLAEPSWVVVGAVWDQFACGAAAVRCNEKTAELASLFVDPQVREKGIGGQLLDRAMEEAGARGCRELSVRYLLTGGELAAMDRLVAHRGKIMPEDNPFVYGMDSSRYREHPLLGAAFRPGFRPHPSVVPFPELSAEQRGSLEARKDIPSFLRPSEKMEPALSVAWTEDRAVTGYLLGGEAGFGDFSLVAAWLEKPPSAFLHLLRAQLNLCFYRCGGDFRYFASPVNPRTERLLERLTGGVYTRYEEHAAVLSPPPGTVY